jgi:hypothetical protein
VFNESTLVLEGVTLAEVVKFVIQMLINLACSTVLDEETTEDSETTHPEDLAIEVICQSGSLLPKSCILGSSAAKYSLLVVGRNDIPGHTSIRGTLPLTETTVSAKSSSSGQLPGTGTRVHGDGLADDEAIGDELADGLAGVGVGDFAHFVGVEPDLALSAANNGRRKALLRAEIDPKRH